MSMRTGPGLPVRAMKKALASVSGISFAFFIWAFHLVTGIETPIISVSWKASVPIRFETTWAVMNTIGTESR